MAENPLPPAQSYPTVLSVATSGPIKFFLNTAAQQAVEKAFSGTEPGTKGISVQLQGENGLFLLDQSGGNIENNRGGTHAPFHAREGNDLAAPAGRCWRQLLGASQQSFHAGAQLLQRHRFCYIFIGAESQTQDFVVDLAQSTEHDDRQGGRLGFAS